MLISFPGYSYGIFQGASVADFFFRLCAPKRRLFNQWVDLNHEQKVARMKEGVAPNPDPS